MLAGNVQGIAFDGIFVFHNGRCNHQIYFLAMAYTIAIASFWEIFILPAKTAIRIIHSTVQNTT